MPIVPLPIAEWAPDLFPIGSPGAAVITNVVPKTPTTYGPMPTAVAYSDALSARIIGSYTMRDTAKNVYVFAGDAANLYLLTAGSTAFTDVSGTTYAGQPWPDTQWFFTSFGQRIVAVNYVDETQTFLLGTDAVFSDLSADAPRAKYCEAVGDFVMLANTFDGVSGTQPQRVWWSAIGDPTSWPTPGTVAAIQVQSDYQDLQQTDFGHISGIAAGPLPTASATIFCEHGAYVATYVGSPAIFSFRALEVPGCEAGSSIVKGHINSGGTVIPVIFYKSANGWYAFNGSTSIAIGSNKIDRFVAAELNTELRMTVLGEPDPVNKLIYWAYSSTASTSLYDRMVVYNWDVNRWSYIDLSSAAIGYFLQTATIGYTLEELDQFGTLETLPYSLDSEAWVGGAPRFGVFTSANELAYLTGVSMAATVETPEVEPVPGKRAFVRNILPVLDGFGASASLGVREHAGNDITFKAAVAMNHWAQCPQRWTGRYVKVRLTTPTGGTFSHISGVEVDAIQTGIRGAGTAWLLAEDGVTRITDEYGNPLRAG